MMSPEDVLLEAIATASRYGDSPALRELECRKLRASLAGCATFYASDAPIGEKDAAPEA